MYIHNLKKKNQKREKEGRKVGGNERKERWLLDLFKLLSDYFQISDQELHPYFLRMGLTFSLVQMCFILQPPSLLSTSQTRENIT